ncbi:MAG: tetratricopeptide repeat protein, partial [Burkholderiales bacterium]
LLRSGIAAAQAQDSASLRVQALAVLKSDDVTLRRQAYEALGEAGLPEDLPILYAALYDADPATREIAQVAIWKVWGRSGDPTADKVYQVGVSQVERGLLRSAVRTFSALIESRPEFTEAWNKRATVYYLLEENDLSIADCEEVLKRNPHHFGALSGFGQLMLRKDEPERALDYFERALTINPNMEGVRANIELLKRLLPDRGKRLI